MKTLKNVKWKDFPIQEIFYEIQRGKRLKNEDHIPGNMPYVSSSAINNGIDDFVSNEEKVRMFKDCITIANSGSVGASFYHPYTFVASDHVTQLKRSNCNKYIYLFLATISYRLSEKYSFNREINESRVKRERLLLPATPDGSPDFKFMEQYMRGIEKKLLERYALYLRRKGDNLLDKNFIGECKYMPFKMKDLLSLEPCRFTGKGIIKNGDIPYVGATNRNNGVLSFLDVDKSNVIKGNCIAFICNGDGSIGLSIYRSTDFIGSVDVKVGRSAHLNRYVGTYMTTVADTVRPHYSFGYKRTMQRLMNESLFLPVASDGSPDYNFMEQYMREKEQKLIRRYIEYRLKKV